MGQDRVHEVLERLGPLTYKQITNQLISEGEVGNVSYSVCKALYGLKKWKRIDWTISTEKPLKGTGAKQRIYRVIK